MVRLVTDYLDQSAKNFPNKVAFVDKKRNISFKEVQNESYYVAMFLNSHGFFRQPIAIFLDKSVECITSFMGVAYSGNFYSPLDVQMPMSRIEKIMDTLHPVAIITNAEHKNLVKNFSGSSKIFEYEEILQWDEAVDIEAISQITANIIDSDVLYVLFTSGSTGVPKGVIISQRSVIDFIEWGTGRFSIDDNFIIANQTPFYFSMSVFDIYQTIKNGATMYIVPREMFSFPILLMQYMYDNRINTIFWVPSALCLIASFRALNTPHLTELKNIFFGGEVMPVKQLNKWIEEYPDARYVNFYGPTEVTDTCTAYEVDRTFQNTEKLPMGKPCKNTDVFLLNENNELTNRGEIGEVCVRGVGLAYGYYNNPQKTSEVFVQNPLNHYYPEVIYRTGDLAQYNDYEELVYISRKDFQIKHMGNRIELGEIETAAVAVENVDSSCCIYDSEKSQIVLYYVGNIDERNVMTQLKKLISSYMLPNKIIHIDKMPFNLNGKIDRQKLKETLRDN